MKSKTVLTALVIAILASNEAAFAQDRGNSQWVQNGADYLLVGIATGMILQIFLSR